MDPHKFISDVLEGKERILSFDRVARIPDKNTTAGALSVLNFARLAFKAAGATPTLSKILTLVCSGKTIESALEICREWPGDVCLEIDDVYHTPLFEASLKPTITDYGLRSAGHVTKLLENLRVLNSSAAVVITGDPEVVTCLRLQASAQEVFVLFNPRATSEHKEVASLAVSTSLSQTVQRLCDIFPLGKNHPVQGNLGGQASKLPDKCAGHLFVPSATAHDSHVWEDALLASSFSLLALKAELGELTRRNDALKKEKLRSEQVIIDLGVQLERETTQSKRTRPSKSSVANITTDSDASADRGPRLTQWSHSTFNPEDFLDSEDEVDPNITYALQLQAAFDSENDFLLEQKHDLMRTAQRQHHCGVCLDDFPEDDAVHIDTCGHNICRDCVRGHVCAKIEEHRFPVLCPVCMADHQNQSPGIIPSALVQLLGVSEKQWETWVEMELAQFSIPFTCRKCQHSAFVDKQDLEAQPDIHCPFPACDHVWCRTCQQTIDANGPKHSCDGTSELDHLMKQQGWRYCPNCKTPIQKTHGCNHLSCIAPGCNTHFCYRCGETINRTAIPQEIQQGKTAHFRTCNLFSG